MELAGKVIAVLEPRSGVARTSGNPWMIQEYVREYQGRWYTDIRAWKVDHVTADQAAAPDAAAAPAPAAAPAAAPVAASEPMPEFNPNESTDDLPF